MHSQQFIMFSTLLFTTGVTAAAVLQGYQTPGNHWVNLTSLPTPRQEHTTVAVDNNTIAILGGVERVGNDVCISLRSVWSSSASPETPYKIIY
jgi:hypothetical protein